MKLTSEQAKILFKKLEFNFKKSPKADFIREFVESETNSGELELTDEQKNLLKSKFEFRFKKSEKETDKAIKALLD